MAKPIPKPIKVINSRHLRFIGTLPCLVTGEISDSIIPHHLLRGTGQKGMGTKSGDDKAIPVHSQIHDMIHRSKLGETAFLAEYGIKDPVEVAQTIYLMVLPGDCFEYINNRFSKNWAKNISKLSAKRC